MEKRLKRIEIAIIILLGISIFNLVRPIINDQENSRTTEQTDLPDLPGDLTRDFLNEQIYKIKTGFNQSNWTELYNVFGEFAKAQFSETEIEREFNKLKQATGNIETYTYSHYIYEGKSDNAEWYEIHYKCRFERGKGTIKVSTRTVEDKSQIVGMNIVLDEL
jgi:hypothetical protein